MRVSYNAKSCGSLRSRVEWGCAAHSKQVVAIDAAMCQALSCVSGVRRCAACFGGEARGDVLPAEITEEGIGHKLWGERLVQAS